MTDEQQADYGSLLGDGPETEKARTSLEAAIALNAAPGPERFFSKGKGLLADVLLEATVADLLLARAPGRELYVYDGGVWKPGGNDAVSSKVIELLGDRNRTTYAKLMIENIIVTTPYVIKDEPDSRYINFTNGMLDWRTGTLYGHNHELMSVNQLPYNWDPKVTCPRTDRFFSEVLPPGAAQLGYEMIGYAMYDGNPLQKAVMFVGSGANGKGVCLHLVGAVLGEENVSAVTLQSLTNERFAAADLYGRLANIAGDLSSRSVEDTSLFKMITGGDQIRAERKHRDAFVFKPRAVPMFSANALPGSTDASTGYMRRWLVVPFLRTFPPEERDPHLAEALALERAGVAVKSVEALRTVMDRRGFTEVEAVVNAQNDMALAQNPVKEFFEDCVEVNWDCTTSRGRIYSAYEDWCDSTGHRRLSTRRFWERYRAELMERAGMTVWDEKLEIRTASDRLMKGVCVAALPMTRHDTS